LGICINFSIKLIIGLLLSADGNKNASTAASLGRYLQA